MSDHEERTATIRLPYGRAWIEFSYDPRRFDVLANPVGRARELNAGEIMARIDAPIGSSRLDELLAPSDRVVVVVPDATRASGSDRVSNVLLGKLRSLGVADDRVAFLIGGGIHRAPTAGEITRILGEEIAGDVRVHVHDAFSPPDHVLLGTTKRGTPIEIDRRLVDCDRVILVGAIGFHYFAGFTGGRKALVPACASDRAIHANHVLCFDRQTLSRAAGSETGRLDGNPLSEDLEEAARLIGPTFLVNTVLDDSNRIVRVYAGDWFAAHRRGCAEYLAEHSVFVPERRPLVIVSAGGAPRDLDMIQSHKALEHACRVLLDGGDLVLLARCSDGLGKQDFLDWFAPGSAAAMAANLVGGYKINAQTAWGIRWKAERYRVHLVSSLPEATVRSMGLIPRASLDEAIDAVGSGPGYILPSGLTTLPILTTNPPLTAAR